MRKLILLLVVVGFVVISVAQKVKTEPKVNKTKTEQVTLKEHVCNPGCKGVKHNLLHGEKGHVCGAACSKIAPLKEHVCTSACKSGKHKYIHGEKGHVCGDACKKS